MVTICSGDNCSCDDNLRQQRIRMMAMIGFFDRGSARIQIRIRIRVRVGVTFNVSVYHSVEQLSHEQNFVHSRKHKIL